MNRNMVDSDTPHILYVDDDRHCLNGVERTLRQKRSHFRLSLIDDPVSAARFFRENDVDLLISDLQMPGMSGLELLSDTKTVKPDVPSMILSGVADFPMALKAINELQVFRLLTKPCRSETLVDAIDAALETGPQRQSPPHNPAVSPGGDGDIPRLESAFDYVSIGLIVVDARGKVHHTNRRAANLLEQRDGLLVTPNGTCKASTTGDTEAVMACVQNACRQTVADQALPEVTWICRPSLKRNLSIFAVPVPSSHLDGRTTPLAALFILDPDQYDIPSSQIVADMFDLTRSEALIVCNLLAGESLEEAAQQAGVTLSTARTYLKRAFAKTGTAKQSELISLIMRSTFGVTAPAEPGAGN